MKFEIRTLPAYRPDLDVLGNIAEIEHVTGLWVKTTGLSQSLIASLKKTSIITSSGASTRIENALMSDKEVGDFVAKGRKITSISSRSEREVAGYIEALQYIYDSSGEDRISEHNIKALHQLMTQQFTNEMLAPELRGSYKTVPNNVVEQDEVGNPIRPWFETTPPGPQTQSAMAELIEIYHQHIDLNTPKLMVIAWFVVHFLAIHPFQDGNRRLSRLLTIWLLLNNGYEWIPYVSHEKFIEDNKEAYYLRLRETQASFLSETVDYHPWISFFSSILARQARYLKENVIEKADSIIIDSNLGKNEKLVMEALADRELSRAELQNYVPMTELGMKKLLGRLRDRGLIEVTGRGKSTKYKTC